MKRLLPYGLIACLLILAMPGESKEAPKIVNLMIDVDMIGPSIEEQTNSAHEGLTLLTNEVIDRNARATLFVPAEAVYTRLKLVITQIGLRPTFEIAIAGNNTNEKLSSVPYSEQKVLLSTSKNLAEACKVCDVNEIDVKGFKPQSFDQNEDTHKVLDNIGAEYDAGFQAGILYADGHQNDVWPYKVEGHNFYALPVSTYNLSGEMIPLQDSVMQEKGLDGDEWYEVLKGKFDDAASKGEPVIVAFSTSTSGSGDYLDAFKRFLDYAVSEDATFVTSSDLINMTRTDSYGSPKVEQSIVSSTNLTDTNSTECKTCDMMKRSLEEMNVSVVSDQNNTSLIIPININLN
jgi:hypothetical protein